MDVPPEIAFRGMEPADTLKELILTGIDDLEEVYPRLVSCRVMVSDTTPSRQSGNSYRARLDIGIPGKTVVVDETAPTDGEPRAVDQTISDAFKIGRRLLQKEKDRQQGAVKSHDLPPHGRVVRLLTDPTGVRYGFLESRDGRHIYFQEGALVDVDYDDLDVGAEVRYAEAEGDKGPQASTVARLDPGTIGPSQEQSIPLREDPRD